jgi:site-specific DNA-methyltransferase (adenine-specific)
VLKPGGHLLAFAGTRTYDLMGISIRMAGFEIRDSIGWVYGSGFPKSMDVSKAIDKGAGAEREVIGTLPAGSGPLKTGHVNKGGGGGMSVGTERSPEINITAPSTPEAKQWQGWGTALKPALEPIVVARKPLIGTVAENVLTHGTGGLNIDASRIGTNGEKIQPFGTPTNSKGGILNGTSEQRNPETIANAMQKVEALGRWPANLILDEYTAELLDEQSDGASRFFYVAKASKRDRNEGLDDMPLRKSDQRSDKAAGIWAEMEAPKQNFHPTVKPTDLMRYLVKLISPPGGTVLDPFTGSGSTGKAAILEGFDFIGIELTEDYWPIIEGRLKHAEAKVAEAKENQEAQPEGLF